MDFSFFITNNKSGYKTREKWFSKNYIDEYNKIIEHSNKLKLNLSFKEKIYFYYNNKIERPKCLTCGKDIKFRERFDIPYGDFCSLKCINENKEEMIKRQKETFKQKYGVNFYPEHKDFLDKQRKTKKERYGNENYNNVEKNKRTRLEKYDNENYNNVEKQKLTCIKRYNSNNYSKSNTYKNRLIKEYKELYPGINFINIDKFNVTIKCPNCNNESTITKQLLYERRKRNYEICPNCNPIGQSLRSGQENNISSFLNELKVIFESSNRKILNGKELDILIPNKNVAIELNGIYWHNELFCDENYHLNKTIKCNEKNIDLVHIFEDEWIFKQDIVKSIIKNRIKIIDNTIFGRKCIIKEVDSATSMKFLNENHIQGGVKSKIRIGLYYNNDLVSLMTFSKGRIIMGGKENEWELTRFCNKINTNVIGGANKLFQYFIKNYQYTKIISYSDIRLFKGGLYEKLGFKKIHQSRPNYWYVINGMRFYRFNFRKSILIKQGFDKNKTEKQIMFERKIYRIYDCGNIRWEYNI